MFCLMFVSHDLSGLATVAFEVTKAIRVSAGSSQDARMLSIFFQTFSPVRMLRRRPFSRFRPYVRRTKYDARNVIHRRFAYVLLVVSNRFGDFFLGFALRILVVDLRAIARHLRFTGRGTVAKVGSTTRPVARPRDALRERVRPINGLITVTVKRYVHATVGQDRDCRINVVASGPRRASNVVERVIARLKCRCGNELLH